MNEAKNIKKINKKKIILVVIIVILIVVAIKLICYFMEKPQVKLIGDSNVSLTLGSEYKELGANATVHKKQINNKKKRIQWTIYMRTNLTIQKKYTRFWKHTAHQN